MSFLTGRSDLSTRTSGTVDVFSGSGVDFTAGSSTTVTLTADPGTENDLVIAFDGVTQHHDTYSVSATTVTFDTAIPTGTLKIEAKYGSTYAVGTVPDDAVTLAKMASGTDGNIISYDTSGNPVAVATGTDGQVLTSSGAGAVCAFEDAAGGFTAVAEQATTSGSSITFSSIPAGVTMIVINIESVSLSASTQTVVAQLGDAGGIETSGYDTTSVEIGDSAQSATAHGAGFDFIQSAIAVLGGYYQGSIILTYHSADTWCANWNVGAHNGALANIGGGKKSLTAELTQLKILSSGTFDNGNISIMYQ